jgi:hypothetical protein
MNSKPFSTLTPQTSSPKPSNSDQCRLPSEANLDSASLIVCETTGRWAVALRRELSTPRNQQTDNTSAVDFSIEQSRSIAECWQRLDNSPAAFVVVELTLGNIDNWLERMTELEWKYPLARVAVVVRHDSLDNKSMSRFQWLAYEAGAVFVGTSMRSEGPCGLRRLADVACRHLQRSPRPKKSLKEEIWHKLPWRRI